MAILSFPSMPKLNITHWDLEDWYRWFWGKDIADRRPPPSEQVLLYAERKCMERDPQPGLWGHGPQGSHDTTSAGHPLLDEGGL